MAQSRRADATVERPSPPAPESLVAHQRARRDRIVDAAVRLMVSKDYDRIQMKEVAEEADVALGTLYRYFGSKEHLFAEALLTWSSGFREHGAPRATQGRSVDQLKAVYRRAVRSFERQPRVYRVLLVVHATTDPLAAELYRTFAERQTAAFASFLPRVPSPRREDIVAVMSAVLDENVREWSLGRQSIRAVYQAVDRAAELLLA